MQLFRQTRPWGLEITGFGRPMGLGVDRHGGLMATDMDAHVVVRFNPALTAYQLHAGLGQAWSEWQPLREGHTRQRPQYRPAGWNGPHAVLETSEGRLLVTCYYDPMVVAVGPDGLTHRLIGREFLRGPASARLDAQGRILVSEYGLNLLLVFDDQGRYLGRVGHAPDVGALMFDQGTGGVPASSTPGGFDRLHMAVSGSDGHIVVADTWNHRLQRFSCDGEYIDALVDGHGWDRTPKAQDLGAGFAISHPVALDVNAAGDWLVTAWGRSEVLCFDRQGMCVPLVAVPALQKPYDARFFRSGMVIADTHHGRIVVMDNARAAEGAVAP